MFRGEVGWSKFVQGPTALGTRHPDDPKLGNRDPLGSVWCLGGFRRFR